MSIKLSAGHFIEARCTKCRALMNHTIVAMVGDRVVRVECNTCKGIHNYHPLREPEKAGTRTKPAASDRKPSTRAPKKDPLQAEREEWEALRPELDETSAIPYDMNGRYRRGNLLAHATFGLGIVKEVLPSKKIEVLFSSGKKLLYAAG